MPEAMPLRGVHVSEDPDQYTYLIWGPAPMMDVAEAALKNAGIGTWSIYLERFGMV